MIQSNQIYNPTAMVRRDSLERYGIRCPECYMYASDYALWMQMLYKGLHLENMDRLFTEYRYSEGQVSNSRHLEQAECARRIKAEAVRFRAARFQEEATDMARFRMPVTDNLLTLIIPFLNEGEEVRNTVASVRGFVRDKVDILVINDASDDGYDYRRELDPYGVSVSYIRNAKRLGVAASRDLGVNLCATPYFLLLDAHMRFYDDRWPARITDLLRQNDRCILCCQTRFLNKENGVVYDKSDGTYTYGAFLPFIKGHYLPDIRWSNYESRPGETVEPIPAVLGAGYAANKRYWNYLHGLEGLLYYGSDEAYISLKTWMEGGQCLLLKDTEIGHIYRKAAPYPHYNDVMVFNHLLISYLLFPQSWRCTAFATAMCRDHKTYRQALDRLNAGKQRWQELRAAYRSIFTVPFKDTLSIHRQANRPDVKRYLVKVERLPEVAAYVWEHLPASWGLAEGKTGVCVWLCHYAAFSGHQQWEKKAAELMDEVIEAVRREMLPAGFWHGLCGVGWAILYLCAHGFIEDDPSPQLAEIDRQLESCDASLMIDEGMKGKGGVLAYATARVRQVLEQGHTLPWSVTFMERLSQTARDVLQSGNDMTAMSYAMQWQALLDEGPDADDFPIELHDWMTFHENLTGDSRFWTEQLTDNTLSSTLHAMLLQTVYNNDKPDKSHENEQVQPI